MRRLLASFEWIDAAFLAGLGLAAWGGCQLSPPITAIVIGAFVAVLCLVQRRLS